MFCFYIIPLLFLDFDVKETLRLETDHHPPPETYWILDFITATAIVSARRVSLRIFLKKRRLFPHRRQYISTRKHMYHMCT